MKSLLSAAVLKLALVSNASTLLLVSSYTFDPMNNSWKPSGAHAQRHHRDRSHRTSPSASASSYSYAPPPAEPTPASGVEFTYDEDDIVRHHYTSWGVTDHQGEESIVDPAFVPKSSLVEIQYNKKTGEVSLLDEEGVVTPEEYKRLMKAIKYSNEEDDDGVTGTTASEQQLQSQERQEDVAVGTTLFFDPEDLDPTDIIDIEGQDQDLPVEVLHTDVHVDSTASATAVPQQEIHAPQPEQGQHQYQQQLQDYDYDYYYPQEFQDYPEPSTEYHHSEYVSSPAAEAEETFESYYIPQPPTEINHPVQHQPVAAAAYAQEYQYYEYSQQPMQAASTVAQPTAQEYYQPAAATASAVMEQPIPSTTDEMEQDLDDDSTYRRSRGFGFAHRRGFFTGSD